MATDQDFVDRINDQQQEDLSLPPKSTGVSGGSMPGGASGLNVPGYPVEVVSTYPVIPLNAIEFETETSDPVDLTFPGAGGVVGVAQMSYTPPPGYVAVIKEISWNIYPRRWFLSNLGYATLMINGIANNSVKNVQIFDSGKFNLHVISPQNSTIVFTANFAANYGTVTGTQYTANNYYGSQCHMRMYGHLLFSRGLPANFEIGS